MIANLIAEKYCSSRFDSISFVEKTSFGFITICFLLIINRKDTICVNFEFLSTTRHNFLSMT